MAERTILAFFKKPEEAEQALEQMSGLTVIDSSIDRFDGYPGNGIDHIENPITGDFPGLGYLTLSGDFDDRNAAILAATSVSASGMSSGGRDNQVTGRDISLTVIIDEKDYDQAMDIVQKLGAIV